MKNLQVFLIAIILFSCREDDQIPEAVDDPVRDNLAAFIDPTETDPGIDLINDNLHYALFNAVENGRGELLLFLGGTLSRSSGTSIFSEFVASKGFHVINLAYPNLTPVRDCADQTDQDCALKYRREVFQGIEGSELVSVNTNNSIENRIEKLLLHLIQVDPQGGWEQYLTDGEISWNKILVSGHSQGAGHAAFIANQRSVKRALMFAGPNDWSDFYQKPANWLAAPGQTSSSNQYAFLHLRDEATSFDIQIQCLLNMGLSDTSDVDGSSPPFENKNVLFTDEAPEISVGFGAPFHGSVVNDRFTPLQRGQTITASVWLYMLGLEDEPI